MRAGPVCEVVHTSPGAVCANRPCRATASPAHHEPRCGLPARPGKDQINDGLLRQSEFGLFQKFREATSPGCPPALQLREHARKREGRQVEAERLQDTGQNRLAAKASSTNFSVLPRAALIASGRTSARVPGRRFAALLHFAVRDLRDVFKEIRQ